MSKSRDGNGQIRGVQLARNARIFASAVQEVLEEQVLEEAGQEELSVSNFHLLKLICRHGVHQAGEAAGFLGVSPPAATKNVDKLVRMGLLLRRPSGTDRRVQLVSASPTGQRLVDRCERLKLIRLHRVLPAFRLDEIEQLSSLLERFAAALYRAGRIDGGFCLRCAADVQGQCPVAPIRGGCPYQEGRQSKTTTTPRRVTGRSQGEAGGTRAASGFITGARAPEDTGRPSKAWSSNKSRIR